MYRATYPFVCARPQPYEKRVTFEKTLDILFSINTSTSHLDAYESSSVALLQPYRVLIAHKEIPKMSLEI